MSKFGLNEPLTGWVHWVALLKDAASARFFVRLGDTTQPMDHKEIASYVLMRWQGPEYSLSRLSETRLGVLQEP